MLIIAGLTFREALRKKALLLAVVLTFAFLSIFGTALHFVFREIARNAGDGPLNIDGARMWRTVMGLQLMSFGHYLASFITAFLAIFSSVGTISSEIDSGVIHAVVTKPLRRSSIVIGKFIGHTLLLVPYSAFFFGSLVALIYWKAGIVPGSLGQALALFCFQPVLILGVSVLGSTSLSTLANGTLLSMLYGIALIGGMVEQVGAMIRSQTLVNLGIITSLLMPTDAMYRKMSAVLATSVGGGLVRVDMGPFGAVSVPSDWMTVYALLYLAVCFIFSLRLFDRRDI